MPLRSPCCGAEPVAGNSEAKKCSSCDTWQEYPGDWTHAEQCPECGSLETTRRKIRGPEQIECMQCGHRFAPGPGQEGVA